MKKLASLIFLNNISAEELNFERAIEVREILQKLKK